MQLVEIQLNVCISNGNNYKLKVQGLCTSTEWPFSTQTYQAKALMLHDCFSFVTVIASNVA